MQHLEVSCAVRRLFKPLGFKGLITVHPPCDFDFSDLWYQTINIVQKKTEFGTVLSPSLRISYIVAVFE